MKIVLATGIYPPDIGGPSTYVHSLARELHQMGHAVTVITYGTSDTESTTIDDAGSWRVVSVPWKGRRILRWFSFARALGKFGSEADVVEAFSSVSVGVPLWLARLEKPKKVLRLGGDFFWERYTDWGGEKTLREWYASSDWFHVRTFTRCVMGWLLRSFDYVVFSTEFEMDIYREYYRLPQHSMIENAIPSPRETMRQRMKCTPFRLLVMSRLVGFKNLESLVRAMTLLPDDHLLTIVGEGPRKRRLQRLTDRLALHGRVAFASPVHGKDKRGLMDMHDLLVLPSLTEISPNAALEARSNGLPVLLTEETGLSGALRQGMILRPLRTPEQIAVAVQEVAGSYPPPTSAPAARPWSTVAREHLDLFRLIV